MLELLQTGSTVAIMAVAVAWLSRVLRQQYEARIEHLEEAVKRCEEDREELHRQITELLQAARDWNCPMSGDCPVLQAAATRPRS